MSEKMSLRERFLIWKKPKIEQDQVASAELSVAPSLLLPGALRSATNMTRTGSINTNTIRRPSNDQNAMSKNRSNTGVRLAERVVPIRDSHGADSVVLDPDTSSQQEQGTQIITPVISLWDQAYDALKESQSDLIKVYEDLLSRALHKRSCTQTSSL